MIYNFTCFEQIPSLSKLFRRTSMKRCGDLQSLSCFEHCPIFLASFLNRTAMASSLITSQTTPVTLQFISLKSPQATMYRGSWPISLSEPSCAGASVISFSMLWSNLKENSFDLILKKTYQKRESSERHRNKGKGVQYLVYWGQVHPALSRE